MPLPSLRVMGIAKSDPSLFESLMAQAGFRIVRRDNDPLNTNVQEEAVMAVASAITEDTQYGVRLSPYHRQLKTLAEQAGYVVMIENCGPPGADPCADEGMGDEGMGDEGLHGEMPMGGEGEAVVAIGMGEAPPMENEDPQIAQIAALPMGTELAAQVLAVINGEGTDGLDDGMGGDEFGGEMGGDEFGGEMGGPPPGPEAGGELGGEELPPEPGAEEGLEEGPPQEGPPEEEEGRPY